jgi:two-component system sensor histidine kinase BaeS
MQQRDPTDRRGTTDGNGLGLAIAKELVEMHGGTIEAKSEPLEGSVFMMKLPISGNVATAGSRQND